jgi:hypothetical protein
VGWGGGGRGVHAMLLEVDLLSNRLVCSDNQDRLVIVLDSQLLGMVVPCGCLLPGSTSILLRAMPSSAAPHHQALQHA